jgi:hypothetical protein
MDLIKTQSNFMNQVATSQLASSMDTSKAFLEMAGSVRGFIGDGAKNEADQQKSSVVEALIQQAGGVLQAYAGAQAQMGALSGIANELGVSPDQLKQVVSSGMIPGLSPAAAAHLPPQPRPAGAPAPRTPQPVTQVVPTNPNEPYPTFPPENPMQDPTPTPAPQPAVQTAAPTPQPATPTAPQAAPQSGPSLTDMILGGLLQNQFGAQFFANMVKWMRLGDGEVGSVEVIMDVVGEVPPQVLNFLQIETHTDVLGAMNRIHAQAPQLIAAEAIEVFAENKEWWDTFQDELRYQVGVARGEYEPEEEEPSPTPDLSVVPPAETDAPTENVMTTEEPTTETTTDTDTPETPEAPTDE